ncbi:polysaccharide lyase 8 family protein [Streptomyces tubbatahanensis]|uniref:Polysaccharide lyase 8 family protein n=1 Tax=Streptomyces tubbatahanensis TaxID=2923272 RepID=A0ABY3XLS8_9ACTN|nr:polysaccharide lyase 8 family protein [Streptomyces tubbatahanensis]UNS95383.1 polysaccharide lyase 8 family protein [Streptomyces tubbatahanensis]
MRSSPTRMVTGRRALLAAPAAALLPRPVQARAAQTGGPAREAGVFETLLTRATQLLTGYDTDPADPDVAAALGRLETAATDLWQRLDRSTSRTALWSDLSPVTEPGNFGQSYTRLRTLALAWATPGTGLSASEEVADALVGALRFLHDEAYHAQAQESGNWWFWEIGAPRALLDSCVLVRAHVPADDLSRYLAAVDRFCPGPDRRTNSPSLSETGANRADKCLIVALRGLLGRDEGKLASARDGLSDTRDSGRNTLFGYVTSGDGFYEDGSFVQHEAVAYTGSYGNVLLTGVAQAIALLAECPWAVTDPRVEVVYDAVEKSFAPLVFDGLMADAVRGRAVSREQESDHTAGAALISAVLLLAESAPAARAKRWRALVKGWLERNRSYPYVDEADVPQVVRAKALLADGHVRPAERPASHVVFADMDRVVHRRPRWALALSLSSRRIAGYEAGNGENLHGWYTGDGMTYLYTEDDLGQFGDGFWPTVDPYRLPGTTVEVRHREDAGTGAGTGLYLPSNRVAGGAALEGRYGVSAMELIGVEGSPRAKKAWFFLDNALVALGAGIRAGEGRRVETVVENRNLHAHGTSALRVDGVRMPGAQGWSKAFDRAGWAHLEGVGGYVFPAGAALRALREERTGAWRDINTGADTAGGSRPLTRRYLTLWFDHGVSPTDGGYAYVVLPGASVAATARWRVSRPVRVAANSPTVQAVESRRDGLTAAQFWQAGTAAGLATDGPASVVVRRGRGEATVSVADPSRTADRVTVRLPFPVRSFLSGDDTVSLTPGRHPLLTVAVGGSRGHTHHARLR